MWDLLKCNASGTGRYSRRTSTLLMVGIYFSEGVTSLLTTPIGLTGKKEGKTRLMNMVMQLRKVACHPYLFEGAVRGLSVQHPLSTDTNNLIRNRVPRIPQTCISSRTVAKRLFWTNSLLP